MPRCLPFLLAAMLMFLPELTSAAQRVPTNLQDFQQQIAETLEANRIPGAGIAIVENGEVSWAGGVGYARFRPEQHAISSTRFRIGSVTKIFTALAVLQLVEQDRLSLDQPVREIVPDVPINNPWQESRPVTIAHLLEHAAGFDDMHFRNMNTDAALPVSLHETMQRMTDELDVRWQPGVMHSYSNPGYAVAGYVVERISGQPFHEYVSDNVLAPLGMQETVWGAPGDGYFARGYTKAGDGRLRDIEPRAIRLYPAGELSSSSADLARLVQFFLQRGAIDGERLFSEESIDRMERPRTTRAADHGLVNGYGLGNYTSFREGFRLHGHNGGLDGFSAVVAYSPEHDFGYVILINRSDGAALQVLEDQATAYLSRNIEAPEPGAFDVAPAHLPENMTGCYRMMNSRNALLRGLEWLVQVACVDRDEGDAIIRHPVLPQVTRLVAVEDRLLRESNMAWPTAVFMADGERDDALQWAGIYFERATRASVTLPIVLTGIALLLMLSSVLFFPVWIVRCGFGGLRGTPAMSTRAWPLLAISLLAFTLFMATRLELSMLDDVNVISVSIFAGGIAFALASFYSLYRVMRTWRAGVHPVVKWHSLLVALGCVGVALYLVYWRLVPLRLWAW